MFGYISNHFPNHDVLMFAFSLYSYLYNVKRIHVYILFSCYNEL